MLQANLAQTLDGHWSNQSMLLPMYRSIQDRHNRTNAIRLDIVNSCLDRIEQSRRHLHPDCVGSLNQIIRDIDLSVLNVYRWELLVVDPCSNGVEHGAEL